MWIVFPPMPSFAHERPFPIRKEVLDTVNSVSWFLLDACWMLGAPTLGYFFAAPTVATGLLLLYVERRPAVTCINLAINSWILMNLFWMMSEATSTPALLLAARVCFGLGVGFILAAVAKSENLKETFSHFRRFRLLKP